MELVLPTQKTEALYRDPRCLVLYSLPKAAKTTICSFLPDSLILDFEGGSDLVAAVKVNIIGLKPPKEETAEQRDVRWAGRLVLGAIKQEYYFSEVITALRKHNPYKFGIADTLSKLVGWCEDDATDMYMKSIVGKYFNRYSEDEAKLLGNPLLKGVLKPKKEWASVLTLPKGGGYWWLRESYAKWVGYLQALFPYLILNAHIKLISITDKVGKETAVKDLDLTGQIKSLTAGIIADCVGFVYRQGTKAYISFEPEDEIICGNRANHLEGKKIFISEKMEDGKIVTHWENIYKFLAV